MARDFDSLEAMESVYGSEDARRLFHMNDVEYGREDDDFDDEVDPSGGCDLDEPLTAEEMDALEALQREYDPSECREEPHFERMMSFYDIHDYGDE